MCGSGRILTFGAGCVDVRSWPTAAYRRPEVYVCLGFLCGRSAVCPETAGTDPQPPSARLTTPAAVQCKADQQAYT